MSLLPPLNTEESGNFKNLTFDVILGYRLGALVDEEKPPIWHFWKKISIYFSIPRKMSIFVAPN